MTDPGHKETDKLLEKMERRIAREYAKAEKEVREKLDDYLRRFEIKDQTWQRWVSEGKKTKEEYKKWRMGQIIMENRWRSLQDVLAKDFHNANQIARSIINGYMPEVYAINRDYGAYEVEHGLAVDTSYTLYDHHAAEKLFDDNAELYHAPGKQVSQRIAAGLDIRWNKQQIQSVMLQAILQGEAIPKIADRLARAVGDSNRAAAIRNARTMTTGIENAGRIDSYKRAESMGIEMEQMWVAALDGRTRHEHRMLDGQTRPVGKAFEVEGYKIMYPGDPSADPEMIYNCRCTLIAQLSGFKKDIKDLDLRHNEKLGDMSYNEWKKAKATSNPITLPEEKAENIKQTYIAEYRRK